MSATKRPRVKAGGGWRAIAYTLKKSREAGGFIRMYKALRSRNACKTCALGMGGQRGGMVNEVGHFPEVCKKSMQAMSADMQGRVPPHFFNDVSLARMRGMSPRELENSGRLVAPVMAGPLDQNYRPISWDDALSAIAKKLGATGPEEAFFYFSGRSSNEASFLLQVFARLWGTNHINNCSYYCHQASGVGLASVTGSGTATVVLDDLDSCDLVFLIGANPASNHPRFMRTLMDHKRRGGKVIVINPLKETGLVRFKVPSDVRSLLFGTTIADAYLQPNIGADMHLLAAIAKLVIDGGHLDQRFIDEATDGWEETKAGFDAMDLDELIEASGVARGDIERAAEMYAQSRSTIFAWAMGVTHHVNGTENVQMIANLAMLRGMLGRAGAGLLPLRGHSNVQGVGSMGVTPKLKDAVLEKLEAEYDVTLPTFEGYDTMRCLEVAKAGGMRVAFCLGGNLYGATPDATFAAEAFRGVDLVVYLSTTLNTGHAHGLGRETIILPVLARDEEAQATTQESMFNYVRMSDGGPARHEGPRSEVEVIATLGSKTLGDESPVDWASMRSHGTIRSAIARIIPGYEAIGAMDEKREEFHIAGRTFHTPSFETSTGHAQFHALVPPDLGGLGENELRLMTVRSEGQFNTVVYEEEDLYRGQERRDVILMNETDMQRLGFEDDALVTVTSDTGSLDNIRVRPFDVPAGNAVMYFPEANVLIARTVDEKSATPAFKNQRIAVDRVQAPSA